MAGMARMVNKVARATMERTQPDGPRLAYVVSFAGMKSDPCVMLTSASRTVTVGFPGGSKL